MAEWIPTRDGVPLKSIDAALDEISRLLLVIKSLELLKRALKAAATTSSPGYRT